MFTSDKNVLIFNSISREGGANYTAERTLCTMLTPLKIYH